jgi:hypothetical protein
VHCAHCKMQGRQRCNVFASSIVLLLLLASDLTALQDCQVLLIYFNRASYFPAPFVDDHGENHKQFRGRPLHLDPSR